MKPTQEIQALLAHYSLCQARGFACLHAISEESDVDSLLTAEQSQQAVQVCSSQAVTQ